MNSPAVVSRESLILVYDADCGFCRWSVATLLDRDELGALEPMTIGEADSRGLLDSIDPADRARSAHVVMPDGQVLSGGSAVPALAARLPGAVPIRALARVAPRLVDVAYRTIAANRMRISRLVPAGAKRRADLRLAERRRLSTP
ncbi:MAG: DUF393 domain-containing protein [Thermoleophilaceae bacterium]|nr:DUF393 domain-containing protein [Thermoleophilaceae bacterium]